MMRHLNMPFEIGVLESAKGGMTKTFQGKLLLILLFNSPGYVVQYPRNTKHRHCGTNFHQVLKG